MLEDIHAASNLLRAALEQYIGACSTLHDGHSFDNNINSEVELSNFVYSELNLVEAYKNKLRQAEAAVKRAKNNLTSVPVNTLPPEVLTHIFHLVLAQQPCSLRTPHYPSSRTPVPFPLYPEIFTHVCSRWRQIALASHKLWSHIDIHLSCPSSKAFHVRAKNYVTRAQQAPLDIHLIDSSCLHEFKSREPEEHDDSSRSESSEADSTIGDWDVWDRKVRSYNPEMFTFLATSPRPRIKSLGLAIYQEYHSVHSKALEHCLANCFPGDLSELFIDVPRTPGPLSPGPPHRDPALTTRFLSFLTEQQLENAWRSTTILSLSGKYPRWSSSAYHGLVDLRLLGGDPISEPELTSILRSSPGLRILHCDFKVYDLPLSNTLISPVVLEELEELNLEGLDDANTKRLLRWLKPGLKPLRLSFRGNPTSTLLEDFFAHSNVREMRVTQRPQSFEETLPISPAMFFLPPQLKALAIVRWGRSITFGGNIATVPSLPVPHDETSVKLDTLCLLSCHYDKFTKFREVVTKYLPRKLILWKCTIGKLAFYGTPLDMRYLESKDGNDIRRLCPSIECPTDKDSSVFLDWD
ncbi:unnamed protein product [Rhizoctonia solani]|uniref:F-box domain-containing protein n=1 Tax=Rhizoctonia solani TaxID=456999 RepID=A0A8H3HMF4_9AGAM|nr:unnamed protein product [Rhizoctonia solani]